LVKRCSANYFSFFLEEASNTGYRATFFIRITSSQIRKTYNKLKWLNLGCYVQAEENIRRCALREDIRLRVFWE
jgi:hypothetical protein